MQAVVRSEYGDWRKLSLESVPIPALKKDQMLVKVEYAAIDASMDHLMQGDPTLVRLLLGLFRPKHIGVGQSFSGTVVDVGDTQGFLVAGVDRIVNLNWEQSATARAVAPSVMI